MARLKEGMKGVYEVEKILAQRWRDGKLEYRIKWLGFDNPADNTWEPAKACDCPDAKKEFEKGQRKKQQGARCGSAASSRSMTTARSSSAASAAKASGSSSKKADKSMKRKAADSTSGEEAPVPKAAALPVLARSSSHVPAVRSADKPVNDDGQIEAILLAVQTEQNRIAERFTELQKYSSELQQLTRKRRDARKQQTPLPPLSVDLQRAVQSALAGEHPTVATPSSSRRSSSSKNKPTVMVPPSKAPADTMKHTEVKSMTIEEKQQLACNIEKLPDEQREKVAEIIVSHQKELKDVIAEDYEVDIESLKPTTLRELDGYVKECVESKDEKPQPPKSAAQKESKKTERKLSSTDRPSLQGMAPHGAAVRSVLQALAQKKADSFSLSGSDSSSSDSSSSDSSSSESGESKAGPSRNKVLASPAVLSDSHARTAHDTHHGPSADGASADLLRATAPAAASATARSAAAVAKEEPKRKETDTSSALLPLSFVHVVKAHPLKSKSPTKRSGGIAVSVLERLLPSDDKKEQPSSGVGASSQSQCSSPAKKANTVANVGSNVTVEQPDKQSLVSEEQTRPPKETEDAQKHRCELAVQSTDVTSDSPWPSIGSLLSETTASRDEEVERMRELEKERRRREASQIDLVSQSEMMANFEDTF